MNDHDSLESQTPHGTPMPLNADLGANNPGAPIEFAPKIALPSFSESQFSPAPKNHLTPFSNREHNSDLSTVDNFETGATGTIVQKGEYNPGIGEAMMQYFDRPKIRIINETYTWKSGTVENKIREVPNTPPHFSEFARSIGVSTRRLDIWAKKYPEFREKYEICKEIYEEFLIEHGLLGNYGAIAMKFVAVNKTKMKDKQETISRTIDLNKTLDQIEAGKIKNGRLLDAPEEDDYGND